MLKDDFLDLSLIEKAKEEKRIHVFKNALPVAPGWDKFLAMLTEYVDRDKKDHPDTTHLDTNNLNEPYLSFKLRCRFWSRLTFQLSDFRDPVENWLPEMVPLLEWARKNLDYNWVGTFALISLMKNRGQIGWKHTDDIDQFQWQCHGTSMWRTGEDLEVETFIEPGDLIFIPRDIPHEIETVTTRAVVNLVLDHRS